MPKESVIIVRDPEKIRLLADFTRAEILRLLSRQPMTETQLSRELGITKAAVGYHLRLLKDAGFIRVERVETERHGILQKYYGSTAALFIVDPDHIPDDVRRYFIRVEMEHLRGIFTMFQLYRHAPHVTSKSLERLAEAMLRQLKRAGERHMQEKVIGDSETLKIKVYAEALAHLTREEEWLNLFPPLNKEALEGAG